MGKRGPKPKPSQLKIANGSAKHDAKRINRAEPRPPTNGKRNPFPVKSHAGKAWRQMVDDAKSMQVLSDPDYAMIRLYAQAWEDMRKAEATIEAEGLYKGRFRHPAWEVKQASLKTCLRILTEFGMSPSARTSVSVMAGYNADSPMAEFVRRELSRT